MPLAFNKLKIQPKKRQPRAHRQYCQHHLASHQHELTCSIHPNKPFCPQILAFAALYASIGSSTASQPASKSTKFSPKTGQSDGFHTQNDGFHTQNDGFHTNPGLFRSRRPFSTSSVSTENSFQIVKRLLVKSSVFNTNHHVSTENHHFSDRFLT